MGGQLWFLHLKKELSKRLTSSCCRIRFVKDEPERIPYKDIVEYRVAIYFPGIGHSKLTLNELRTMAMPTLFPAKTLMYQIERSIISGDHIFNEQFEGCSPGVKAIRRTTS